MAVSTTLHSKHIILFCVCDICCLQTAFSVILNVIIRLEARLQSNIGDLAVFGYNSAESELIWMKSGAL